VKITHVSAFHPWNEFNSLELQLSSTLQGEFHCIIAGNAKCVAELVNAKTRGFLLYCNLFLYDIFKKTETFFVRNGKYSDCYERTLSEVFENVSLTFPCDIHKAEILAVSLHYYIMMRMRHNEREENRLLKKKAQTKKKEAKLSSS
jgi:hypothetical protein